MHEKDLNRHSLANQIYDILKEWILTLQIGPGERIDTRYLEKRFHVSHAPIRDALNHLLKDKLITVKPRVGYFVVDLTISEIEQLWDVRMMLERHALEITFDPVPIKELESMKKQLEELMQESYDSEACTGIDSLDMDLHRGLIIGRSENKYVVEFYQSIYDLLYISMHITQRYRLDFDEHMRIIESWLAEDYTLTEKYLIDHLTNVKEKLVSKLREKNLQVTEWKTQDA